MLAGEKIFLDNFPDRKICLCVFNRATYGRSKSLIEELSKYTTINLTVTLSSSLLWEEYGNAQSYITKMKGNKRIKFEPIDIAYPDKTHLGMAQASADILSRFSLFFSENKFDAVIVVADRFETLPCAMAASYLNIPVIHIQGGEITGNVDDRVRHAVTQLADYHFVSTELAKQYVAAMGQDFKSVFNTGCPSLDIVIQNKIKRFKAKEKYVICIFHPETDNTESAYDQTKVVMESVIEYCRKNGVKCYWFYPNPDPGREEIIRYLDSVLSENKLYILKAINKRPEDFLWQLAGARFIIGNSSCGIRESSFLGVPSINVGDRQGIRERAENVIDCDFDAVQINDAMTRQTRAARYCNTYPRSRVYGAGHAGEYIAKYILRLPMKQKTTLTYPYSPKFKEQHFGEERFHGQKNNRSHPFRHEGGAKINYPTCEPSAVQGEHGSVGGADPCDTTETSAHTS